MGRGAKSRSSTKTAATATLPLFASAMRQQPATLDRVVEEPRPSHVSTGLASVDQALRGGFAVGGATLVAARPDGGGTSLLLGAALSALERGERVAVFTETMKDEQLRARMVVMASKVNGYRFRAGFVTAEDRIALAVARERIPWTQLTVVDRRKLSVDDLDAHLFSYRPLFVIADMMPRAPNAAAPAALASLMEGAELIAGLARKHQVALALRWVMPQAEHVPDVVELPGVGALARPFDAVAIVHRDERQAEREPEPEASVADAQVRVLRVAGHDVEPRIVPLRFDQRFAGLLEL